jgi:hypothetical protein
MKIYKQILDGTEITIPTGAFSFCTDVEVFFVFNVPEDENPVSAIGLQEVTKEEYESAGGIYPDYIITE